MNKHTVNVMKRKVKKNRLDNEIPKSKEKKIESYNYNNTTQKLHKTITPNNTILRVKQHKKGTT